MLSPSYLRGSKAILFMFALDDRQSLVDLVNVWFKEVVGHYIQESNVVLYLVGLKVDKVKERAVTRLEAEVSGCNDKSTIQFRILNSSHVPITDYCEEIQVAIF